ncbi:MAG: glycosyltransferase [Ruminococcaceae bacterium]|nr:glycosyltransferase [Oscillospiraceae bacterium]
MIKVAEIISDRNIGGAGVLLVNRLKNSDRNTFKTVVILPRGSELKARFEHIGISTVEIDAFADRSFDAKGILVLSSTLKKLKPDIVNTHACLGARVAARIAKIPILIHTKHCIYPIKRIWTVPAIKFVNRALDEFLGDKTIAVASVVKKQLVATGIAPSRIRVIINGAEALRHLEKSEREEVRNSLGIAKDDVVVTICARLEKCKDHETFLRAAAYILQENKKYRFLIIGGGTLENDLKAKAIKYDIEKNVIFTGKVDDVAPYMNITDVNVNCSVGTETSSLALSEGMSLGIPAVVSDYGGNPYMVRNGVNGYVFPKRNARALADRILKLSKRELYERLSNGALKRFEEELNSVRMTKDTEILYALLADRKDHSESFCRSVSAAERSLRASNVI